MSTSYHHDSLYNALDSQVPRNLVAVVDVNAIDADATEYSASFLELHNTLFLFKADVDQFLLLPSLEKLVMAASSGNGLTEGRALHFVVQNWGSQTVHVVPAGSTGEFIHDSVGSLAVGSQQRKDFLIKLEFLPEGGRRNGCGVSPLGCGADAAALAPANATQADPSTHSNKPAATDCCSDRLAIARACKARYVLYVSGCCGAPQV